DGDMEAANLTNWIASGAPTTREKSGTQVHGGAQSLHIVASTGGTGARSSNIVTTTGKWYRIREWVYAVGGKLCGTGHNIGASNIGLASSAAEWTQITLTRWELAGG